VKKRFGAEVNQLYKYMGGGADLEWNGPDPTRYVPTLFEPHIDSLPPDAERVRDLIDVLNNGSYEAAAAAFDVASFLKFIAIEVVTGETDAYLGGGDLLDPSIYVNNFYLYRVPATGRYLMIAWDRNEDYWRLPADGSITHTFDQRVLTRRLILERSANLALFKGHLKALLDGPHATDLMQARVDFIFNQIRDLMAEEPQNPVRPRTYQEWVWEVGDLRNYIRLRNDGVRSQLP
jgi:hypothetical protein